MYTKNGRNEQTYYECVFIHTMANGWNRFDFYYIYVWFTDKFNQLVIIHGALTLPDRLSH